MYHGYKAIGHSFYVLLMAKCSVQIQTKPIMSFGCLETKLGNRVLATMCTERGNEAGGTRSAMWKVKAKSKLKLEVSKRCRLRKEVPSSGRYSQLIGGRSKTLHIDKHGRTRS